MKRTLLVTLAVLVVALAVCAVCQRALDGAVEEAGRLQNLAVLAASEQRFSDAKTLMGALAGFWQQHSGLLEMMAGHDALHDVASAIAEAQICLECEDRDDFLRTMSNRRMGLEHLRDEEAVSLMNLY